MNTYLLIALCLPFIWGLTLYLSEASRKSIFYLAFIGAVTNSILQLRYLVQYIVGDDLGATLTVSPIPNMPFTFGVSSNSIIFGFVSSLVLLLSVYIMEQDKRNNLKLRLFQAFTFYGCVVSALYSDNLIAFYSFWEFAALIIMVQPAVRTSKSMKYLFITWIATGFLFFIALVYISSLAQLESGLIDLSQSTLQKLPIFASEISSTSRVLYWFIVVSLLARVPLFPAFFWVKNVFKHINYGILLLIVTCLPMVAFSGINKFVIDVVPQLVSEYAFETTIVFSIGVLYSALSMIRARSFRSIVANLASLQCSVVAIGMFSGEKLAITGGKVQIISYVVVLSGLLLFAKLLESVYGTTSIATISNSSKKIAQLTSTIILIVLASIGSPLSLGFHGYVLILSAVFEKSISIPVLVMVSMVIMLISYLSKVSKVVGIQDGVGISTVSLPKVTRVIFWIIGAIIIVLGIFPRLILNILI